MKNKMDLREYLLIISVVGICIMIYGMFIAIKTTLKTFGDTNYNIFSIGFITSFSCLVIMMYQDYKLKQKNKLNYYIK